MSDTARLFDLAATGFAIRRADAGDAVALSDLIRRTVAVSNAPDYTADALLRVMAGFTPQRMQDGLRHGVAFLAEGMDGAIGTASLVRDRIEAVFVLPRWQGTGVGTALVSQVVETARGRRIAILRVMASLTAVEFYRRLGFVVIGPATGGTITEVPLALRLG